MKKPIILLDCDGPLANFTQAYLDALFEVTGFRHEVHEVDQWSIASCEFFVELERRIGLKPKQLKKLVDAKVSVPGFCENIQVEKGAYVAVEKLKSLGEVWIVTSPWDSSPTWEHERRHWVHRHFDIPKVHVIQAGRKIRVHGDFFVDDKVDHILEWSQEWPRASAHLFAMKFNASVKSYRRSTWEDIIQDVERFV